MLINRIAVGRASGNGDPIAAEAKISSEVTLFRTPTTTGELDKQNPIAIDETGGRYFPCVTVNGEAQIRVVWPDGRVKSLDFALPRRYTEPTPSHAEQSDTLSGSRSPLKAKVWVRGDGAEQFGTVERVVTEKVKIELPCAVLKIPKVASPQQLDIGRLIWQIPVIVILLIIALVADISGFDRKFSTDGSYFLGGLLVVIYFIGVTFILRFGVARCRIHITLAIPIMVLLYIGYIALHEQLATSSFRPSFICILCLIVGFKTLQTKDFRP